MLSKDVTDNIIKTVIKNNRSRKVDVVDIVAGALQTSRANAREIMREAINEAHPACTPDMRVNGGALKLALNVLRRAGKHEVADELEIPAQPL